MSTNFTPQPKRPDSKILAPPGPFTHHQIFELVGPFARGGRHVDLDASDRAKRCLVFKPVAHTCDMPELAGLVEILRLENPRNGHYRLTRNLVLPNGLQANLSAEGADPGGLLARVEWFPPQAQFRLDSCALIALSYNLQPTARAAADGTPAVSLLFSRGEAHVGGLAITLSEAQVTSYPAEIDIVPLQGGRVELPEDFLAVLGREWGLLRRRPAGWSGSVRVGGTGADRAPQLQARLQTMVAHVAATLARPPADFHETLRRARWGVTGRRAIPLLFWSTLIAGAGLLRFVTIPPDSIFRLLLIAVPGMLMVGAFSMRDRPPFEIPPVPRRLSNSAWGLE